MQQFLTVLAAHVQEYNEHVAKNIQLLGRKLRAILHHHQAKKERERERERENSASLRPYGRCEHDHICNSTSLAKAKLKKKKKKATMEKKMLSGLALFVGAGA